MPGMVPDNDVQGHFRLLLGHLNSKTWQDLWRRLDIQIHSFEALGLPRTATDRLLWQTCQQRQVVLITGNRNDDGPDSLNATLQDSNQADSLPVFTLANLDRIRQSPTYVEEVVVSLLDYLMRLDDIRGAGRIWLP